MSLPTSRETITYAPRMESFARAISDEDPTRIESDPVVRSTILRQAADLVEPDWIVVDGTDRVLAAIPDRNGAPIDEHEFTDLTDSAVDDLAEVVRILTDVRSEPVVPLLPDPVTVVTDLFDDEWTDLLASDEFAALDLLHGASQSLTDVIRLFESDASGFVLDAPRLTDAVAAGLELEDYLLEAGAVFNLADHRNASVIGSVPATHIDDRETLAEEFDLLAFGSVDPAALPEPSNGSGPIGCSFPEAIWDAEDAAAFRREIADALDTVPASGFVLMQRIPRDVDPEYVQVLGDVLGEGE